jgi:hypothetical protein
VQIAALQHEAGILYALHSTTIWTFPMSRQLAISAVVSVLAMAGLALAAPAMADRNAPSPAHAEAGATLSVAAPQLAG